MDSEELRKARKAMGLTQGQLGENLGITREWVGLMERGAPIESRTEFAVRWLLHTHSSPQPKAAASGYEQALARLLKRGYTEGGNMSAEIYDRTQDNMRIDQWFQVVADIAAFNALKGL